MKTRDEFLYIKTGEKRKKQLRQYCLDKRVNMKKAICDMIDATMNEKKENGQCSKK
jgi:hypothetical protein